MQYFLLFQAILRLILDFGSLDELRISGDASPSIPPLTIDLLSVPSKGVVEVEADITGLRKSEVGLTGIIGIREKGKKDIIKTIAHQKSIF